MTTSQWYQVLIKPTWAPPPWLFGPVWTFLYIIITLSFGTVFYQVIKGELPTILILPFILNIIFNLIFIPLQFGLQNNVLAAVDILFVLGTLIWSLYIIYPYIGWVMFVNIPYLAWVLFATTLQLTITYLNK